MHIVTKEVISPNRVLKKLKSFQWNFITAANPVVKKDLEGDILSFSTSTYIHNKKLSSTQFEKRTI